MLNLIFGPAMAIMSRLRFALKLGLIGALFMVPLAAVVYFLNGEIAANIKFAETERLGVQQLVPARQLLQAMQKHRRASVLTLKGDAEARQRLPGLTAKADAAILAIGEVNASSVSIKMKDEFASLSESWEDLKRNLDSFSAEESLEKHNSFIEKIVVYMKTSTEKSNLSFDPEMDSFYLVDAITEHLPNSLNFLGQFRGLGFSVLTKQYATVEDRIALNFFHKSLVGQLEDLEEAIRNAAKYNPAVLDALNSKMNEAFESTGYFKRKEAAGLINGEVTLPAKELFDHGTAAIASLYDLFDASLNELDALLVGRIHRLQRNLFLNLGAAGAGLVLVLYLFGGLLLSVLRSLKAIEAGADRLVRGDVSQFADSHSQDELRRVAFAVNCVITTLEKFTKAQLEMAHAHNREGLVSHQMPPLEFAGAYGDMARNLNEMVKGHIEVQTQFADLMGEYAHGKFDAHMDKLPGEREKISDAAEKVRAILESTVREAQFNALVKTALDHVSTPVRLADEEGKLLYINNALKDTLRKYETGFRQQIPGFNPDAIVGGSIGVFYADAGAAIARLRSLTKTTATRMVLGGRDFDVVTSPVFGEQGQRIGSAGQWNDITEQLAAEREVAALVEAAAAGDFSKRIAEGDKSGFMLQMAQGLNRVLSTSEQALGEIGRIVKALADGDLTQKIEVEFKGVFAELQAGANSATERLRDIIGKIREASDSISTAAREIAAGNDDLAQRTESEAASLERTAGSVEELATTVRANAENAAKANTLAADTSASAARGGELVARVVATMDGITDSNREISDITSIIDGIAFQTNLLALNAAVEAARAGDSGSGFAVVAGEVRRLAQRAAEAAKDIKTIITGSVGKVEDGAKLVQNAASAMHEIMTQAQRVTTIMGEIAAASREQSDGVQQVNQTINQIDQITQQNAALVEEATAAARSLEDQSEALVRAVSIFKLTPAARGSVKSNMRSGRAGAANGHAAM